MKDEKSNYDGVIFDLDGVIVSTDEYHFEAWKKIAEEEAIYFDRELNDMLRGVSRMESLEIILRKTPRIYDINEKLKLAQKKNDYYKKLLNNLTQDNILPGVKNVLNELKEEGLKIAVGSSSKNAYLILVKIGLWDYFDAVADGNEINKSKPDPEVFLLAAQKIGLCAEKCLVIEDADAGVEAALAAGMKVVGVGAAANNERANYRTKNLSELDIKKIMMKI